MTGVWRRLAAAGTGSDRRSQRLVEDAVTDPNLAAEHRSTRSDHLIIEAYRQDDRRTLVLTGELDLASARSFEDTVVRACVDGASELVLELGQLEFIDARGLDAVLSAKTVCARSGCAVSLTPMQCSDRRTFELARLAERLPFRRSSRMKVTDPSRVDAVSGARIASAWD
jgi:anti-anti-sigma factor